MMYRTFLAAINFIAASFVYAQVEVVDRSVPSSNKVTASPVASGNAAEIHYQLQILQQEVLQLRGMAEQQAFEIKKLKQQRLDDYLDLDRRLSELSQGGGAPTAQGSGSSSAAVVGSARPDEMKNYKSAMNLVLREQKYNEAIVALNKHLEDYPRGRFSANAQYWLGEVYMQKKELEKARQWFSRVLGEYPEHTKVPDAQYKLGIVYHKLGDEPTARKLLEEVAQSSANAARLAREYLDTNFPSRL